MLNTKNNIIILSNEIIDAIKALIILRRLDADGSIFDDGKYEYNKAEKLTRRAMKDFNDIWKHIRKLSSKSDFILEMINNYNFMLNLWQSNATVEEKTRDTWLNKPYKTLNDIDY